MRCRTYQRRRLQKLMAEEAQREFNRQQREAVQCLAEQLIDQAAQMQRAMQARLANTTPNPAAPADAAAEEPSVFVQLRPHLH